MRRALGLIAAATLAGSGILLGSPPVSAAATTDCTTSTGTIVAVDFAHWAGPVVRGCDTSNPSSGYTLLHDVGFATTGTQHDGPAFICRLGNSAFHSGTQYPTPAQDACVVTPPARAYWSYWLAPAGQDSWSYSQRGAMSDVPKPGEIQLWIFGGTNTAGTQGRPSCTPASLRPGASPPATHCSPVGSGGGSGGGAGGAPRPGTSAGSKGGAPAPGGGGASSGPAQGTATAPPPSATSAHPHSSHVAAGAATHGTTGRSGSSIQPRPTKSPPRTPARRAGRRRPTTATGSAAAGT